MTWPLLLVAAALAEPTPEFAAAASACFAADEPAATLQARLDAAIDRSVDSMTWMFRPVARPRMKATIRWCRAYTLRLTDGSFSEQCDAERPMVHVLGRSGVIRDDEGDPMRVTLTVDEPRVTVSLASDKATYTTTWLFREGGLLDVVVHLTSPHFAVPMDWQGRYRRVE